MADETTTEVQEPTGPPAGPPAEPQDGVGDARPLHRVRRPTMVLAALVVLGALVGVIVASAGSGPTRAPSFGSLPRLGGGAPLSLVPGRPTAITFFASWCSPCRSELPVIARVASQESAAGGKVTVIGIDGNDDPASGLAFARASGVTFAVGEDSASAVAPRFGLDGYPDTVFVDAKGDVAGIVRGPISASTLQGWLTRLSS